jgi:hypothetical protein
VRSNSWRQGQIHYPHPLFGGYAGALRGLQHRGIPRAVRRTVRVLFVIAAVVGVALAFTPVSRAGNKRLNDGVVAKPS